MRVSELMTKSVASVGPAEGLNVAAQQMWDYDCGSIPVVDSQGRVNGVITDRDICMATWSRGLSPAEIRVADVMSSKPVYCSPQDSIATAEQLMRVHRIRRIPVVDGERHLLGIVSFADMVQAARRRPTASDDCLAADQLAATMAAICNGGVRPAAL